MTYEELLTGNSDGPAIIELLAVKPQDKLPKNRNGKREYRKQHTEFVQLRDVLEHYQLPPDSRLFQVQDVDCIATDWNSLSLDPVHWH